MLVGFSATGRPIGGVHARRKQWRRRIVVELDDKREHQADEVAVLSAEVEAKNAAGRICRIGLFMTAVRNVAQGTGLGGIDRLTGGVILGRYRDRPECNRGRPSIDQVLCSFVAYPGISELLELAHQLHTSKGAKRGRFAQQFRAGTLDLGQHKRRGTCLGSRLSNQSRFGTVVCGGFTHYDRQICNGCKVSWIEVRDVQSIVMKASWQIGPLLAGELDRTRYASQ